MGAFGLVLFGVLTKMFGYGLCKTLKMQATIVMKSREGLTNVGEADTMYTERHRSKLHTRDRKRPLRNHKIHQKGEKS